MGETVQFSEIQWSGIFNLPTPKFLLHEAGENAILEAGYAEGEGESPDLAYVTICDSNGIARVGFEFQFSIFQKKLLELQRFEYSYFPLMFQHPLVTEPLATEIISVRGWNIDKDGTKLQPSSLVTHIVTQKENPIYKRYNGVLGTSFALGRMKYTLLVESTFSRVISGSNRRTKTGAFVGNLWVEGSRVFFLGQSHLIYGNDKFTPIRSANRISYLHYELESSPKVALAEGELKRTIVGSESERIIAEILERNYGLNEVPGNLGRAAFFTF